MSFHPPTVYGVNTRLAAAVVAGVLLFLLLSVLYHRVFREPQESEFEGFVYEQENSEPEPDTDRPSLVRQAAGRIVKLLSAARSGASNRGPSKPQLIGFTLLVILFSTAAIILWFSWNTAGPIDTIVYAFLFIFAATFFPVSLLFDLIVGDMMRNAYGKLHFIMGQLVFQHGWLVQIGRDTLELVPGREDAFWYDGNWYTNVDDAVRNQTVMGWMPFTMAYFKDEESLSEYRVDPRAIANGGTAIGDGGSVSERGGFEEAPPPTGVSGMDGTWLADAKALFGRGLEKIGDMSIIQRTEQVEMQKQAKQSRVGGWEPIIGVIAGLLIGILVGYVMVGGT